MLITTGDHGDSRADRHQCQGYQCRQPSLSDSGCRGSFGYRDVVEVGERLGITEDDRERIAPGSECPSRNQIKLSRPEICHSGAEFAVPLDVKGGRGIYSSVRVIPDGDCVDLCRDRRKGLRNRIIGAGGSLES